MKFTIFCSRGRTSLKFSDIFIRVEDPNLFSSDPDPAQLGKKSDPDPAQLGKKSDLDPALDPTLIRNGK